MIISRIIKPESAVYKTLSTFSEKLDRLMKLKPLSWFAVWIMMTSGTSAQQSMSDRYIYWDMSLAGVGLITLLIVTFITIIIFKKTNHLNDCVYFANVMQKFITQALTLGGSFY